MHKVTCYLLANLAVSDMLLGLAVGLHAVSKLTEASGLICVATSIGNLAGGCGMSGVLLLCLQSFLCMRFPTQFRTGISKRLAAVLILMSWLLWMSHSIYGYIHSLKLEDGRCPIMSQQGDIIWISLLAIVGDIHMVALTYLQVSALIMIRVRKRYLKAQVRAARRELSTIGQSARHLNKLEKISKLVSIVGLVLVIFIISWGPFLIGLSIFSLCDESCKERLDKVGILPALTLINSLGNIFIYWKKSEEFRLALSNICHCRQRVGIAPPTVTVQVIEAR